MEAKYQKESSVWDEMFHQSPFLALAGQYVGQSTCNNFTSVLGAGQRVLSYAYYRPYKVDSRE